MDLESLRSWLAEPRTALVAAVAEGVREHVATLGSRGIAFYGYALLPGEPYDISSLVAVTNDDTDIPVPPTDDQYRYYRYCVDEWANWEHDVFAPANALLAEANERFASLHDKGEDDCEMDEFEAAHSDSLLDAVTRGLEAARAGGVFGVREVFLAVWISDSGHPIMPESVRRLNPEAVAGDFMAVFE